MNSQKTTPKEITLTRSEKPETVYTMDLMEACCYYYLFQASITVDCIREEGLGQPLFIVTGHGLKEFKERARTCRDKYMSGLDMESVYKRLGEHLQEKLAFRAGMEAFL
jgi:hypothetical protein